MKVEKSRRKVHIWSESMKMMTEYSHQMKRKKRKNRKMINLVRAVKVTASE
jgi:hypothetical protein